MFNLQRRSAYKIVLQSTKIHTNAISLKLLLLDAPHPYTIGTLQPMCPTAIDNSVVALLSPIIRDSLFPIEGSPVPQVPTTRIVNQVSFLADPRVFQPIIILGATGVVARRNVVIPRADRAGGSGLARIRPRSSRVYLHRARLSP